jgi:hypothetical protein
MFGLKKIVKVQTQKYILFVMKFIGKALDGMTFKRKETKTKLPFVDLLFCLNYNKKVYTV